MENNNWINIFKSNGWKVEKDEDEYYITWHSPKGEEFTMYLDGESPISDFIFQTEDFDIDEHVEMLLPSRGKRGVPKSIKVLVEDAEAIKKELERMVELIDY